MKFDLSIVLMGLIALLIFVVPVFMLIFSQNNKNKFLRKYFTDIALQKGLTINEADVWGKHYFLGIDNQSKKLFFATKINGEENHHIIDLNEIKKCKIDKKTKTLGLSKGKSSIGLIYFVFMFRSDGKESHIEIFNDENGYSITDEHAIAEKWIGIINK